MNPKTMLRATILGLLVVVLLCMAAVLSNTCVSKPQEVKSPVKCVRDKLKEVTIEEIVEKKPLDFDDCYRRSR
jgi:hypothetical protein